MLPKWSRFKTADGGAAATADCGAADAAGCAVEGGGAGGSGGSSSGNTGGRGAPSEIKPFGGCGGGAFSGAMVPGGGLWYGVCLGHTNGALKAGFGCPVFGAATAVAAADGGCNGVSRIVGGLDGGGTGGIPACGVAVCGFAGNCGCGCSLGGAPAGN